MQDLMQLIPEQIKPRLSGKLDGEVVIPYPDVLEVIQIASTNSIAVLGVEIFQLLSQGELLALDYSTYQFPFQGDWENFTRLNNAAAVRFVETHVRGEEHGYILTSTSKREFQELRRPSSL